MLLTNIFTKLVCFCAAIVVLLGCNTKQPKYGFAFNAQRQAIGLPMLASNWKYIDTYDEWGSKWVNAATDNKQPRYFSKFLKYDSDTILWECNEYVGNKEYNTIDGKFRETLYVSYVFVDDSERKAGWYYVLQAAEKSNDSNMYNKNFDVTKAKADSLLSAWRLK